MALTVFNYVNVDLIGIWDLDWFASVIRTEVECSVTVEIRIGVSELSTLYILGLISSIFEDLVLYRPVNTFRRSYKYQSIDINGGRGGMTAF